jgi:hypothetical protein
MKWVRLVLVAGCCCFSAGCHSAFVDAVVVNHTAEPVSLVEVDYPSASFGTQSLAPGQQYKYRFKVLGSGALKVLWTDAKQQDHTVSGPELHEGDEGGLTVAIEPNGKVEWQRKRKP